MGEEGLEWGEEERPGSLARMLRAGAGGESISSTGPPVDLGERKKRDEKLKK